MENVVQTLNSELQKRSFNDSTSYTCGSKSTFTFSYLLVIQILLKNWKNRRKRVATFYFSGICFVQFPLDKFIFFYTFLIFVNAFIFVCFVSVFMFVCHVQLKCISHSFIPSVMSSHSIIWVIISKKNICFVNKYIERERNERTREYIRTGQLWHMKKTLYKHVAL